MFLCVESPGARAVIEDVEPHRVIGSGFRVAGIRIHDFTRSQTEEPIIGVAGYPPHFGSGTSDARGYVVDLSCPHRPEGRNIELIVGLTAVGSDGGGWLGADVSYSVAGQRYVLEIANNMIICGTATQAEWCSGPRHASGSP
jgi:hypothetical protein